MAKEDSYQTSYIRQKVKKSEITISGHALENMGLRKIRLDEALEAVLNGKEVEIQQFEGKMVRVTFQESTEGDPKFAVVVAADHPEVVVVTVFNFNEEKFEYIEGQKCWRRKK
ncbi:MAG: DUF4258 domain-containing protein [Bacillota bacterium]|nr:DUF4258 domain-containing protein [Bacillota bacterium]